MIAEQVKSQDIKRFLKRFETQRFVECCYHLGRIGRRELALERKVELAMVETGIRTKAEKRLAELEEAIKAYELNHRRMRAALEFILAGNPETPGEAKRMQSRAAVALRRVDGKTQSPESGT